MQDLFETLEARRLLSTFAVSNTNDAGTGSLRQAIALASGSPGADVVQFDPGISGTITLAASLPINTDLTINGPGSSLLTIDGVNIFQVFKVPAGVTATINGLTATRGVGDPNGGGINNAGTLTLHDVGVTFCTTPGAPTHLGGGIMNTGSLTIFSSVFSHDVASTGKGSGLANTGTLVVTGTTFDHDAQASLGGGVYNAGNASFAGCTFSNDGSSGFGGAIFNDTAGTLAINGGTLSSNTSNMGGAIYSDHGQLTITGATLSLNSALATGGGLGFNLAVVSVMGVAFTQNTATQSGGAINAAGVLTIDQSSFEANQATGGGNGDGGAINHTTGQLTVSSTAFISNHAAGNGGAICNQSSDMVLTGATIDQNSAVNGGGVLQFIGQLAINTSNLTSNIASAQGGGAYVAGPTHITGSSVSLNHAQTGGGIYASDFLTLDHATIDSNQAVADGGGVYQQLFRFDAENSSITSNHAGGFGGGLYIGAGALGGLGNATIRSNSAASGGGVWNRGNTGILTSTISSNSALGGGTCGGIGNSGTLTIDQSYIAQNVATSVGGILNQGSGTLTITSSTLYLNSSGSAYGGGLMNNGATATIINSTLNGNTAMLGGGIYTANGALTLHNCTIAGNTSGGVYIQDAMLPTTLVSTIVAGNSGGDVGGSPLAPGSNHDLVQSEGSAGGLANNVNANIVGVDPLLDTLGYYGGPTPTMSLRAGSPALAKGSNPDGLGSDQRTYLFSRGTAVDIGAFQRQSFALVVDTTQDAFDYNFSAGHMSLREAIWFAGPNPGNDTITFAPSLNNQSIGITGGFLSLWGDVTITGPGANLLMLAGNHTSSLMQVQANANVFISGLTFTGGSSALGAGIGNGGTLSLLACAINANTAPAGNGAGIWNGGVMTLSNSTVSGNAAGEGNGGGIYNSGTLTITDSTIAGNSAPSGGAIHNAGTLTVRNSTIASNTGGGGVQLASGTATIVSTILAGNAGGDVIGGTLASGSTNNLVQDGVNSGGLLNNVNANIVGVNPLLAALANKGGPVQSMPLQAGSPAINKGANPSALTTDARGTGYPRVRGLAIDIGAVEFSTAPTADALTPSPASVQRGQGVGLSIVAADADGSIARVDFYRDANGNGVAEASELIGSDFNGADGYGLTFGASLGLPLGTATFLAVATDDDGMASAVFPAVVTITNANPSVGGLTPSAASFGKGDPLTLTASLVADVDGAVVAVRFYADVNGNGMAEGGELLGADTDGNDGFQLTLNTQQSMGLPTGAIGFLVVAVDSEGAESAAVAAASEALFSVRAGAGRLVAGSADSADASRVVSVSADGHVIVFEQGWSVVDLQSKSGAPAATSDPVIWLDPKDNLTYVACTSDAGLLLFTRSALGSWTFRNLSVETGASDSPTHGLTQFTSVGGIVVVAGLTATGAIVGFKQAMAQAAAGGPAFGFIDISADLAAQGMVTPSVSQLISYVPTWDSWHLSGIDAGGRIQSVWIALASFDRWRTDDLSAITGAPAVQGQLAVTLTSWGGINLTGLDSGGNLLTTWWVPSFGGDWIVTNLTSSFSGAPLAAGKVSGWSTPWGGLNYVGLGNEGKPMVYWWAPGVTDWSVTPLLPDSVAPGAWPIGSLTSGSSAAGTLGVFGSAASGDVLRMWWRPGASAWTAEDLSALAVRV